MSKSRCRLSTQHYGSGSLTDVLLLSRGQSRTALRCVVRRRCSSRAGDDHGPAVRRRVLRGHRHRPRAEVPQGGGARRLLQPAELHRGDQRALRPTAAGRHRQEGAYCSTGGEHQRHPLGTWVPSLGSLTGLRRTAPLVSFPLQCCSSLLLNYG